MRKYIALVILGLFCSPQLLGAEKRILIIGDSITAGFGVGKEEAYPALLEKKLNQGKKQREFVVVNAGSSGSTTASAVGRLKWHLKKKPHLLLIALGGNDGLRGTPLDSSKKNLASAIDLAKKSKIKVFLVGMKLPINYGKKYRSDFEKLYKELSKEKKISFIPYLLKGVGAEPQLNLADGIHPNEKGHKIIAETVYQAIKGAL